MKSMSLRALATIALSGAAFAPVQAQETAANPGDAIRQGLRNAAGETLRGAADQISGRPATTNPLQPGQPVQRTPGTLDPAVQAQPLGQPQLQWQGQAQPLQTQPLQTQPQQTQPQQTQPQQLQPQQLQPQSQPYQANRPAIDQSQSGIALPQAMVQKFKKCNEGQIELANMAASESKNDQVRQFAQRIANDHQQLNQQLSSWQPQGNNSTTAYVPQQLMQIGEQAATNCLRMTKEQLRAQKDKQFDMAYVGHQVVAHTATVAELEALQSQGPQEIQGYVNEALQKTQQHLKTAKQLASQMMKQKS